jgi:hypothetical protein
MPTTKLLACASTALIDNATNSLSLIEIMEAIESPGFPVAIPRLVAVWLKAKDGTDPETSDFFMEMTFPGAERRIYPMHVDFQGQLMHRSIVMLVGIPVTEPGEISISVLSQSNKRIANLAIPVRLSPTAQLVQEPPSTTAAKKTRRRARKT